MGSTATVTPSNFELSPMRVTFNSVDLGGTKGGASLSVKYDVAEVTADQFGKNMIDGFVSGQMYTVKLSLAEPRLKANWKVAFPHAKLVTSGGNKMMYFDMQVGDQLSSHASILILHPLSKDNSDLTGDFKFFKAVAKSASEVKYGPEEQTVLEVEFQILPDVTVSPAKYMIHGDPSIGLVAATLTQSSYVGTGNGVLSSIVAGSAAATETITATCVTAAANGGVFHVNGSVSGSLGLATVAVAFSTTKAVFTIGDGSTDYIVGDVFTLASVAANYA